jgi:hypothetical protein
VPVVRSIHAEIFEAFRSNGVAEDKAIKAAEVFGKREDDRIDRIDARLGKLEADIVQLKADTEILKWMMGFAMAFEAAIFAKLFFR